MFNACDVFLNDTPKIYCAFDSLRATYTNLQKRWDSICAQSQDRLEETDHLHRDWEAFNAEYARLQTWIKERAVQVSATDVEASKVAHGDLEQLERELEELRGELTGARLAELDAFNDAYCDLAREYRLDTSDDLKNKFIAVNHDWEQLSADVDALLKRIRHSRRLFENFAALREREMTWLRGVDARLTEVEFASVSDRESKRRALAGLRAEVAARERGLEAVGEASLHLVQRSELRDAERVEELAQEFADLRGDVSARLQALVDQLRPDEEAAAVSEEDSAVQDLPPISVNTSIQVRTQPDREARTRITVPLPFFNEKYSL